MTKLQDLHSKSLKVIFRTSKSDTHFLVQLLLLVVLIAFPFFSSLLPFKDAFNGLLAISFILYGILLAENPRFLFLLSGACAILIILLHFSVINFTHESQLAKLYFLEAKLIIIIFYMVLLGLHLLRDTLNEAVSMRLLYISMQNYLLIGLIFNYLFQLVQLLDPGAFNFPASASFNYSYLSFIILTSVGLGDMLPLSNAAKSLVVMEATAGQFYLTFFVALIVGKYLSGKS